MVVMGAINALGLVISPSPSMFMRFCAVVGVIYGTVVLMRETASKGVKT